MVYGAQPDIAEPSVWLMAFLEDLYARDRIDWWLIHPTFRQWFLGWFSDLSDQDIESLSAIGMDAPPSPHPIWPAIETEARRWFRERMPTYEHTSGEWNIVRSTHPLAPNVEELRVLKTGPVEDGVVKETVMAKGYIVLMRFDPELGHHAGDWYIAGYGDRVYEPGQGE